MKAMQLVEFGDPPRFEMREVADPVPAADEVVVDVVAAALNRRDPWVWTTPSYCPLPVTLGSDGAGVVSSAGAAVTSVAEGDEVVIYPTLNWGEGELFLAQTSTSSARRRTGPLPRRSSLPPATSPRVRPG